MKNLPDEVLDYVNSQIDTLTQKTKFSLGELTAVVDAAFALSGNTLSGSTALVYVADMRGLKIVLNKDATLALISRRMHRLHEVPDEFKPSPWVVENTQRLIVGTKYQITPLCKIGLTQVAERDVVWLRQGLNWMSVETSVTLVSCDKVRRSTSVLFPAIVSNSLRLVSVPSDTFNQMVQSSAVSFDVIKTSRSRQRKSEIAVQPREGDAETVNDDPKAFYLKFVEIMDSVHYSESSEHERTTLMHVLINTQMSRYVINRLIF